MLLTLVEGFPDRQVFDDLQKFLNADNLLKQTSIIYENLIKDKEEEVKLAFT